MTDNQQASHQSVSSWRDRIAEVIYGDGNELSWARCVQLADLVMWEMSTRSTR